MLFIIQEREISAQQPSWNYFYRVYFRDKGGNNPNNFSLTDLFQRELWNGGRKRVRLLRISGISRFRPNISAR